METKKIDAKNSSIKWTGKKVTGKHHGSIQLKDGQLEFENGDLQGGEFTIDMSSINVEDLSGENKEKLEGHLHSDDFFNTNNHSTATMTITGVTKAGSSYGVSADLEIKGEKNPVTFDLDVSGSSASTEFKIDRTKYGIRYGSGSFFDNLGDSTIKDEFVLDVNLKF